MKYNSNPLGDNLSNFDDCTQGEIDELENEILKQKLRSYKNKNLEIGGLRHFPSVFFVSFLLIISIMTVKFTLINLEARKSDLYMQKFSLHYYSEFLGTQSTFLKFVTLVSLLVLAFTYYFLMKILKQRVSVPELIKDKWKNTVATVMGYISIVDMIGLTFYGDVSLQYTKEKFGLVDNILFFGFMLTSFLYCAFTYSLLNKINGNGLLKNKNFLMTKRYLMFLMILQIVVYITSVLLVSFYTPKLEMEKSIQSVLILALSVNSIIYLLSFIFFIWTLQYDLYFVTLNMQIMPDIEYFVDLEENIKLTY